VSATASVTATATAPVVGGVTACVGVNQPVGCQSSTSNGTPTTTSATTADLTGSVPGVPAGTTVQVTGALPIAGSVGVCVDLNQPAGCQPALLLAATSGTTANGQPAVTVVATAGGQPAANATVTVGVPFRGAPPTIFAVTPNGTRQLAVTIGTQNGNRVALASSTTGPAGTATFGLGGPTAAAQVPAQGSAQVPAPALYQAPAPAVVAQFPMPRLLPSTGGDGTAG